MAKTKEQLAARAEKQRERDRLRREDPAEREKDRLRMKKQREANKKKERSEEWKENKRHRDKINQRNRRARLKAEAEALQEAVPEIGEGAEKSPQGSGDVLTERKKRTADEVNTPCRPTREGKRRCLNKEFQKLNRAPVAASQSDGAEDLTTNKTSEKRNMRRKTEGQLQRAIRRGRFPRESLVVDRNKFRVVNGKVTVVTKETDPLLKTAENPKDEKSVGNPDDSDNEIAFKKQGDDDEKSKSTDEKGELEDTLPLETVGLLPRYSVKPRMVQPQVAVTTTPGQRVRAAKRTRRTTVALSMRESDTKYNRWELRRRTGVEGEGPSDPVKLPFMEALGLEALGLEEKTAEAYGDDAEEDPLEDKSE